MRTFGVLIKHTATANFRFWSFITGDKMPENIKGPNGPDELKTKAEIMPILNKQKGFVEILALENEIELTKSLIITLWQTKLDAERYEKETFPKVKQILEPFLTVPPVVKIFNVEETISEKMIHMVVAA